MRGRSKLLAAALVLAGGPAAALLTDEAEVRELFAALPTQFVVESTDEGADGRVFRLRSAEPIEHGAAGALYLRATVAVASLSDAAAAEREVGRRLAAADPDTGLSYAWDYVTAADGAIVHLHAACSFPEESFRRLVGGLGRAIAGDGSAAGASFWCRCGGGCRSGRPLGPGSEARRRLPPVRRPADEAEDEPGWQEEYDNRLDPSGVWTSPIGDLALMHHAAGLSFVYDAVFGPTAHICEGAGVAGLVGTDRYEYVDEQGRVAFVITDTGVRLETVEGIASFCGAGWSGDRFEIERYEAPRTCTVAAERSHFHVEDRLAPERRRARVVRGDRVEAVAAWQSDDGAWMLARFVGPVTTSLGLLARRDLDCPGEPR